MHPLKIITLQNGAVYIIFFKYDNDNFRLTIKMEAMRWDLPWLTNLTAYYILM